MKQKSTGVVVVANDSVTVASIPVGVVGSGVIKRRIYRSRVNAGANATKYFVTEIADNTTTSYLDVAADTTIILNAEGPTDNGIPPTAKIGRWFQKGMVYLTSTQFFWSRPGTNLNETPETVPAGNYGNLANAGEAVAAVEFNQRLYLFQKRAIGKCSWRGSSLQYEPVQRSGDSGSQAIGAYDQMSITVVADRYIMWKDAEGQDWKMLPNEEIFPESRDVANINNGFNNLPLTSSLDYYVTDTQAQWQLGTVGGNLSTSVRAGTLSYHDRVADPFSSNPGVSSDIRPTYVADTSLLTSAGNFIALGGYNAQAAGASNPQYSVLTNLKAAYTANVPLKFRTINLTAISQAAKYYGYTESDTITLQVYKFNYETGLATASNTLLSSTTAAITIQGSTTLGGQYIADGVSNKGISFTLPDTVYIPQGEKFILRFSWSNLNIGFRGKTNKGSGSTVTPYGTYSSGSPILFDNFTGGACLDGNIETSRVVLTTYTSSVVDAGTGLQRWHWFTAGHSFLIKSADSIKVDFEVSSDGTNFENLNTVYRLAAIPGGLSMTSPLLDEQYLFYPRRDYRVGQASPAGTQWRYGRFKTTIDPNRLCNPTAEVYSAVSTTEQATFATNFLGQLAMMVSSEASFAAYDKVNYLRDIYTSEVIDGVDISVPGVFYADYVENQQNLTFQVITSATADFSASTWRDVLPGQVIPSNAIVASARYMKYRIFFQDDLTQEGSNGDFSFVNEVKFSWGSAASQIAPYMPPILFYYKDYIFSSWPSKNSRIHDRSLATDAYKKTYEDAPHAYSSFTSPHYVGYAVVQGALIGAPGSGGKLLRLRNSEVADDDSSATFGPNAYVEIHPWVMGNFNVKTLYWVYVGLQLAIYRDGFFLDNPGSYPTITGSPLYTFDMLVGALKTALNTVLVPGPGGSLGAIAMPQEIKLQRPLSSNAALQAAFGGFKPYVNEYGFNVALQERSFAIRIRMRAVKDSAGNAWFPVLTGLGTEYHVENTRGI